LQKVGLSIRARRRNTLRTLPVIHRTPFPSAYFQNYDQGIQSTIRIDAASAAKKRDLCGNSI